MRYSQIKDNDIANSFSGINMSVWTQGCPHHCKECFNKETWDFNGGKEFTEDDILYIINNINKNNIKRNLSILGGEPLCPQNILGVVDLCSKFKEAYPEKKIYLWTGYTIEEFNETQKQILNHIDILIDGKFELDKKDLSLKMRGSFNQRIIDVKETLKQNKVIIKNI